MAVGSIITVRHQAYLTADGSNIGYVTVNSVSLFYLGAKVWIRSDTQPERECIVVEHIGSTQLGLRFTNVYVASSTRSDMSAYTVADNAIVYIYEEQVVEISRNVTAGTYFNPTILVDSFGRILEISTGSSSSTGYQQIQRSGLPYTSRYAINFNGPDFNVSDNFANNSTDISLTSFAGVSGTWAYPSSITVDSKGRITNISSGSASGINQIQEEQVTVTPFRSKLNFKGIDFDVIDNAINSSTDVYVASNIVRDVRAITAGTGLTGGGDLSADRTISIANIVSAGTLTVGNGSLTYNAQGQVTASSNPTNLVLTSRNINTGTGLTGGGDLSVDRTINIDDQYFMKYVVTDGPGGGVSKGPSLASGYYKEVTGGFFPTTVIWWDSPAKIKKVVEKTITRSGGGATNIKPTPISFKIYASDGSTVLETITDAITYVGVSIFSVTRTIT